VELALRGRIALEKTGLRRRSLGNRKVVCVSETPTGDTLLDEALKHIKDTKPLETTQTWIDYLSGRILDTCYCPHGIDYLSGRILVTVHTGLTTSVVGYLLLSARD